MQESHFDKAKTDFGSSGSFEIAGIPVNSGVNWAQFNERRREFLSTYRFDSDASVQQQYEANYFSHFSAQMYRDCLIAEIRFSRRAGVFAWVQDGGVGSPTIRIVFDCVRADNDNAMRRVEVDVTNGTLDNAQRQRLRVPFATNLNNINLTIVRADSEIDRDLSIQINVVADNAGQRPALGASSLQNDSVLVPRRLEVLRRLEERSERFFNVNAGVTSRSGGSSRNGKEECRGPNEPNAAATDQDWRFVRSTARFSHRVDTGVVADCRPAIMIESPDQLCGRVTVDAGDGR
jgi:hypothetical protein